MAENGRRINRRMLLVGAGAAGLILAGVVLERFGAGSGLSERMLELKGLLLNKITGYREYREALERAEPRLRQTMAGMPRGGPGWYAGRPEVRAERESRFYAMSAAERIMVSRAETVADCDFQHAVIELYEQEFDDQRRVARRHFWARIAERRAQLTQEA